MRLKDTFITHDSDGEQVLIDVTSSFAGLVRSNKSAAFIVECLKTDSTKEQIVEAMYEKYDAPKVCCKRMWSQLWRSCVALER